MPNPPAGNMLQLVVGTLAAGVVGTLPLSVGGGGAAPLPKKSGGKTVACNASSSNETTARGCGVTVGPGVGV